MRAERTVAGPAVDLARRADADRIARLATRCRLVLLEMIHRAGSGHAGSSLSCADIVSVLRFDQLDRPPGGPGDVFVLSKGHAAPAWYAALVVGGDLPAGEVGTLRALDSRLQGHPDRTRLGLVDVSTGALGQGLSVAVGRALARRLHGRDSTVYCLLGDGECQEGQVWEAFLYAGARRVPGLVAIIDHNGSQSDGAVADILPLYPLPEKLRAFGWHVAEVDGHDHGELRDALRRRDRDAPTVIIAHTRKGRLGPDRVLLDGSHSDLPSAAEYAAAVDYLETLLETGP
ncbi:transketolase [Actinoallomurus spadix]|uniref:Transketolase n=1 Tax=Actinoallomurus spadix TaxID=79912 RepID=A0ABN0XRI0_9ACTN|nr:transketolase [Actinoallomurus spadix]MCO5990217.1 transketolase [Actinoallomurus spadix]